MEPILNTRENNHTVPLIIVTVLFFMWGLLTALNDVLIPHLKSLYTLTYVQAMLVQFCFFGAYFVVSWPAGLLIKRIGYQRGAVTGLVIAAGGCALFYPAAESGYALFLAAFFVLASGITVLQVAANPYVTILGSAKTASSRLTLTQAFNSLGTTIAPALGGFLILSGGVLTATQLGALSDAEKLAHKIKEAAMVQGPYLALAGALLLLAVLFAFARLPGVKSDDAASDTASFAATETKSVFTYPHLSLGALGIFLYVGGEVSIGSFLINFLGESQIANLPAADAARYVSFYWGGAMVGRFIGSAILQKVKAGTVLGVAATAAALLVLTSMLTTGSVAMWSIILVGFFNSIMFPCIFTLGIAKLGPLTGDGSGILIMAIVGGAILPVVQGAIADRIGIHHAFILPVLCYAYIVYYGLRGSRPMLASS
ncbi:MAG: sugar MFS transporter [Burkholderiales bacterium]|nr:sugar MFS transporter [Burkholderiales bacterium]